ncbi:MAG: DUF3800 domain-containing protein [Chloroflexi bacterium]|nr:DUF3800 domain-containing protein [Chloroflexota bacterium]
MKTLYMDWSGDPGFKFNRGSSKFLAFACLATTAGFAEPLKKLRDDYRLGSNFYFHFKNASELIKPAFFSLLAQTDITAVALRVDKPALGQDWRKMRGDDLVAHFVAETVAEMPAESIDNAVLLIDGSRDEVALQQRIRIAVSDKLRRVGSTLLKDIRVRPAREEDGLQVADMLAGATASEHIGDNALLGYLHDKAKLIDFTGK